MTDTRISRRGLGLMSLSVLGGSLLGGLPATGAGNRAPRFTVSDNEMLMSASDRRTKGLATWPDGTIGFDTNKSGLVAYAANGARVAKCLHSVEKGTFEPVYTDRAIKNVNSEFGYAAGGPVLRVSDDQLLLLYHAERYAENDHKRYYSTLGLARSVDDGLTFSDIGEIVRPEAAFSDSQRNAIDVGGGSIAVKDGTCYIFFDDRTSASSPVFVSFLSAPLHALDDLTTRSLPLRSRESFARHHISDLQFHPSWLSVVYCETFPGFLLAFAEFYKSTQRIKIAWSRDGLQLDNSTIVEDDYKEAFYPSILPVRRPDGTLDFYLYYTASNLGGWRRWEDAQVRRRRIALA